MRAAVFHGPGDIREDAHTVDEWTTVEALVATAHAYTVLPSRLAEHFE